VAFGDATRHAAHLAPIITPPKSGCQENPAMKALVAGAAWKDALPSGTASDTVRASIFVRSCRADAGASARSLAVDLLRTLCPMPNRDLRLFATVCELDVDEAEP
jgi:hypothetical protein